MDEKLLPPGETPKPALFEPLVTKAPSVKQQSWGVVISIVIIVLMIVVGAFYAWGKRIAEEKNLTAPTSL